MKALFPSNLRALLAAALLPVVVSSAAESPSVLLQKGIYAEEIELNLDSAIKIYEQIAAEAATNRAVVAQAQYRLAVCYQKKGDKSAAIRLLNELGQQPALDPELRTAARDRLSELGAGSAESFAVRRVSTPGDGWYIATSGDERLLAYWPKGTQSVVIHEIASGKTLTTIPCEKGRGPGGWIPALFSPDNQWFGYDDKEEAIFLTKVDGSETKKLFEPQEKNSKGTGGAWTTVVGWSADSTELLFTSWAKECECRVLYAANIKTGAVRELARPPFEEPGSSIWRFSANGRYLARMSGIGPRRIRVLDVETREEQEVALREDVTKEDRGSLLGWVHGDSRLLFTEFRGLEMDVWSIPMKMGKRAGNPELLVRNLRSLVPANGDVLRSGVSRDGTLFYQTYATYATTERTLWAVEGLLTRKTPVDDRINVPVAYLMGPNNSIRDQKFGLSATFPAGWEMSTAFRRGNTNTIIADAGELGNGTLTIVYFGTTPWPAWAGTKKPEPGAEAAAWLTQRAEAALETAEKQSVSGKGWRDFKRHAAGVTLRQVGLYKGASWSGSHTKSNVPWTHHVVRVVSANAYAQIHLDIPSARWEEVQPVYESFLESVRLP